ncbi:hypothetical protein [Confluentibacter sediminis]|uniref:hypothetical protein n=1 Tax=Confluentibacter sediminis TaxID=2219045 RepID=UPI000DAEB136|nr:hypothetical protein [Confluentibacter sediminis]
MNNPFFSFTIKAFVVLGSAFIIHITVLNVLAYPLFNDRIIASYIANLFLIIAVFGMLYLLKRKYKSQLGFLFLVGSALKFTVFFIFFYPFYKLDNDISRLEFAAFFIPYIIGLFLETISLSKWLNNME